MKKKMWFKRMLGTLLSAAMLLQSGAALAAPEDGNYITGDNGVSIWLEDADGANATYGEFSIQEQGGTITLTAKVEDCTDETVTWTADSEAVKLIPDETGNGVTIKAVKNAEMVTITATSNEDETATVDAYVTITGQLNGGYDYGLNILFIGNSITKHPPNPVDGWYGDWGMAASSEDKDYVHQVLSKLGANYGAPDWTIARSVSSLESITDTDTDEELATRVADMMDVVDAQQPNIINYWIGENSSGSQATREKVANAFIDAVVAKYPDMIINLCTGFWASTTSPDYLAKHAVAADETDNVYVTDTSLAPTAFDQGKQNAIDNPYCAFDMYTGGVGAHPGDLGMEEAANRIVATLSPVIEANFESTFVKYPDTIDIEKDVTIDTAGGTYTFVPTITPADAASDVIWSVSNEKIATISEDGTLTAINNTGITDDYLVVTAKSKYNADAVATSYVKITGQTDAYTLTYAAGTTDTVEGLPEADPYAKGTYTLSADANCPTRAGYNFAGWSLTEGGDVVSTVDVTAATTVYAVWNTARTWEFEKYYHGFTVENGFNVDLAEGTLMAIATGMTEEAPLTIKSPAIAIDPTEYNTLYLEMTNSVISGTKVKLNVTTESGTTTYELPVTIATKAATYEFALDDITETITGFEILPTNIDASINIERIAFTNVMRTIADGYYSEDLLEGQIFGDTADAWKAKWGHGFTYTLDSEESIDGGTSVRLNSPGSEKSWWYKADLDADKYGVMPGDSLVISGWMKRSEDFTMTETGKTEPKLLLNNGVKWEATYIDGAGKTRVAGDFWRGESRFLTRDTSDWQYVTDTVTIPTSGADQQVDDDEDGVKETTIPLNYVPAGCVITNLELIGVFGSGYAQTITGDIWFDQWTARRANPNTFSLDSMPTGISEEEDSTGLTSVKDGTTVEVTSEEKLFGDNAYKFTVTSGTGFTYGRTIYNFNKTYESNAIRFKTGFWIKLSQEYIDAYPNPMVTIYRPTYYAHDANNLNDAKWNIYQVPTTGVNLKATTDWQYVVDVVDWNMAEDAILGGAPVDHFTKEEIVYDGTPIYIKESRVEVKLQAYNTTFAFEEPAVVYTDKLTHNIYEIAYADSIKNQYNTRLVSANKIVKDGKLGMRVFFNDNLITDSEVASATYVVNGKPCTDYEFSVLESGAAFDIYPANTDRIVSFKIYDMQNCLGGDVYTVSTDDYYSEDLAEGQLFGDSIDVWDAKWGNGFVPTLDSTESVDGGTSVKLANPVDADGNPVAKNWWYAAYIDGEKYGIKGGDSLTISGWVKYGEGFTMTQSGKTEPEFATNNGVQFTITYLDPETNEEKTYGEHWRGTGRFVTKETSDWQYVTDTVTIPAAVPAGATITNIELLGEFGMGYAYTLTGDIWFDRWTVKRATDATRNMLPAVWDHETGDTTTICANPASGTEPGFTTAELTQEEVLIGDYAYKFAGEGQWIINGGSFYYRKTFDSPTVNLRNSFWIKLPQEYLDAYPNPSLWIFNNVYYAQDAANIPSAGWDKYQVPSTGYALQATTDWQFVDCTITHTFAQDEEYVGKPIYIMQNRPNIRLQAYDAGKITIPEGTAIYADDYKFTFAGDDTDMFNTYLMSLSKIEKDGKTGVRAFFNDALITETEALLASINVNGAECTEFDVEVLGDAIVDFYPNVEAIETFEIANINNCWGADVDTELVYVAEGEEPEEPVEKVVTVTVAYSTVDTENVTTENVTKNELIDGVGVYTNVIATVNVKNDTDADVVYDAVIVKKVNGVPTLINSDVDGDAVNVTAAAGQTGTATFTIDNDLTENTDVTVYVWETIESMKPVIAPAKLQ